MEILGIITARGKSKRIPNKNLMRFMGKPLLWYTIKAARQSQCLTRIVCSSDSPVILSCAKKYGVQPLSRSARAATDTAPIEGALRDALAALRKKDEYVPDAVVLLYGNVPFRRPGLIDDAVRLLTEQQADAVVSVSSVDRYHPERLALTGKDNAFIPYVKSFSTYRAQELRKIYFIDSGVIALKTALLYGKDPLIISHYFKGRNVCALVSEGIGAWDIDNRFDLALAGLIMKHRRSGHVII